MMLSPPPDKTELDREALSEKGTEQYLRSLERKLGKLEGSNKKKLTSRDLIASLSEAREDHMKQLMSDKGTIHTATTSSTSTPQAGLYDPWKPHNSSTNTTTRENAPQSFEHDDPLEGHIEISQQSPVGWKWLCCSCCSTHRVAYTRTSQRITHVERQLTSLTPEEESAFLLDCDELGLTWEKNGDNT